MFSCFIVLLLLLITPYVVLPIVMRSKVTLRGEPVMAPLAPEDLPQDVVQHFAKAAQPLATNEFDPITYFSVADMPPGTFSFVAFWTNPKTLEVATVIVSLGGGTMPLAKQRTTVQTSFHARFDNGFEVVTNNNPDPPWMKLGPSKDIVQVLDVESAAVVFRLHSARAVRLKPSGAKKVLPAPGEEMKWFREMLADQLQQQVAAGYVEPSGMGTYRLSWLGAFVMGTASLPPFKQVRRWRVREKGEAELKLARGGKTL